MSDLHHQLPDDFSGIVRLFPLPELVLFPHVVQPLYVFEPRYVEMFEHALMSDHLIAMATLNSESLAENALSEPPLHPHICLGKIITHAKKENGHYNVLLAGLARGTILEELPQDRLYRRARVRLMDDFCSSDDPAVQDELQDLLREHFLQSIPNKLENQESLNQLLHGETSLGMLVDVMSFALPLSISTKQHLLGEPNVEYRAKLLLDHFDALSDTSKLLDSPPFPPNFSQN